MNIIGKNIKKYYGSNLVLNIDNIRIKKGKLTGISGPNGCGKSTFLHIIAGLDKDFSGEVLYDGQKLSKNILSHMTLVPQEPYLFKRSVFENIAYPLKIRNYSNSEIKIQVDRLLKKMDIYKLKDQRADKLSGGETQKVSLARGLIFNPKVLMLDEPTSNIDLNSVKIMEKEILNFVEEGGTVLMVTHDEEQSKRLCEENIFFNRGKIEDKR